LEKEHAGKNKRHPKRNIKANQNHPMLSENDETIILWKRVDISIIVAKERAFK
jgi:hypothetical protein